MAIPSIVVVSLADVELVPTHAGPHRLVLARAPSISDARAMLFVLRAKGVLLTPHAAPQGFDQFAVHAALAAEQEQEQLEGVDSDGSGSGSDLIATDGSEGVDSDGSGSGSDLIATDGSEGVDSDGSGSGSDLSAIRLILSDGESDGGGNGAGQDAVAPGWVVENLPSFRRAIELGILLEEITGKVIPRIVANPNPNPADADDAPIRRLRNIGNRVRGIGKDLPELMGQAPVTLGNRLKSMAAKALSHGTEGLAWVAARSEGLIAQVMALYDDTPVTFDADHDQAD